MGLASMGSQKISTSIFLSAILSDLLITAQWTTHKLRDGNAKGFSSIFPVVPVAKVDAWKERFIVWPIL
jgi:formate/nitrite transporter FocA (FNT family)